MICASAHRQNMSKRKVSLIRKSAAKFLKKFSRNGEILPRSSVSTSTAIRCLRNRNQPPESNLPRQRQQQRLPPLQQQLRQHQQPSLQKRRSNPYIIIYKKAAAFAAFFNVYIECHDDE